MGYFHAFLEGVDYVFVDHPCFHARAKDIYGGERQEIQFRCALLCKAALESVWHVTCGGVPYGDNNTVFIANDWHTALLPVYLQVRNAPCCVNLGEEVGRGAGNGGGLLVAVALFLVGIALWLSMHRPGLQCNTAHELCCV